MNRRPRIVVLDDWERFFERLADWSAIRARADVTIHTAPLGGDALAAAVGDAEVLVLMRDRTRVDEALIARMPNLRHVIHTGARNQALDSDALKRRGIGVGTTDWGPSKASTCEQTWALILAGMRSSAPARWRVRPSSPGSRRHSGWPMSIPIWRCAAG